MARTYKNSDEEILADIRRVAKELDKMPSSREFAKESIFPLSTVIYRFKAYSVAVEKAMGQSVDVKKHTDQEIIEHFQKLAKKLGHPPLCHEYREDPLVCIQTIFRRFKSYSGLRKMAGFDLAEDKTQINPELLLNDLENIIKKIGKVPTVKEYSDMGSFSYNYFSKFFGGLKWAVSLLAQGNRIPEGVQIGRGQFKKVTG